MKTPHKHAALIKAWADGAEIEVRTDSGYEWTRIKQPSWVDDYEYRIKPEPKPDVVAELFACLSGSTKLSCSPKVRNPEHWEIPNLKLTFDGETGKLQSAEVV